MFVILLSYVKPLEEVDRYLALHRAFLADGYQKNFFLASGPQNPRDGGVILSPLKNKQDLIDIMADDPFHLHGIAEYQIIEFDAVLYHPCLESIV
jgi:uncharacterized protein YciI